MNFDLIVVMDLIKELVGKYHEDLVDNFLNSLSLQVKLQGKRFTALKLQEKTDKDFLRNFQLVRGKGRGVIMIGVLLIEVLNDNKPVYLISNFYDHWRLYLCVP